MANTMILAFPFLILAAGVPPDSKPDYTTFSNLIHQVAIEKMARQHESRSNWGSTVPIDPTLRLQSRRVRMNVDGREVWPNGVWTRTKLWLDDPAKDVRIEVRDLRKLENGKTRISIAATVAGHVEHERQRWRNGIQLIGFTSYADGIVTATFDCDAVVTLSATTIPPTLTVEPKVVGCRLELGEYALRQVGPVGGEGVRELGNDLRGVVTDLIHSYEPKAQELANKAIARALKDGKATLPASLLLKAAPILSKSP